jgi:hypothetical protein
MMVKSGTVYEIRAVRGREECHQVSTVSLRHMTAQMLDLDGELTAELLVRYLLQSHPVFQAINTSKTGISH